MSNATDLLRNRRRKHYCIACGDHAGLLVPISYQIALFVNNSGLQAGSPSGEVSTSGTAYARQPVVFAVGTSNNIMQNGSEVLFPTPTADWGTIPYAGIFAEVAASTWELWWWNQLTNPNTGVPESITIVNDGARARFQAGKIKITLT